ncbi:MAG: fructose-bisphosphatase class III [Clostridia bacterium]|nr:fructose-bisphosphatase class III [Clostridia bacterium]
MYYVCSDLHGFNIDKFKAMLKEIEFSSSDFLWILGDVIDRGADGIKILKWLMSRSNAELILGNHEAMMLACDFLFDEITEESVSNLTGRKLNTYLTWVSNSGQPTLNALSAMRNNEIRYVLEYLREAPLYETLTVNGKDFILTHSGFGSFSKDKKLSEYSATDLLWNRPKLGDEYFEDVTVVFGHTPTVFYGDNYRGKAIKTKSWIDIDVGAGLGLNPMILRLDDLKEFYFDDNMKIIDKSS